MTTQIESIIFERQTMAGGFENVAKAKHATHFSATITEWPKQQWHDSTLNHISITSPLGEVILEQFFGIGWRENN